MAEDISIVKPRIRRRQLIVARKFQLKYAGVILGVMFATAAVCSYIIYYMTMVTFGEKLANVYPQGQLVSIIRHVNMNIMRSMILISPFVIFLAIYLSHKIAGPVYRIEKTIGKMIQGDLSTRIKLRRGDEMMSLAEAVNRLTDSFASTVTSKKAHLENMEKELGVICGVISTMPKENSAISNTVEKLKNEIDLAYKDLEKYRV